MAGRWTYELRHIKCGKPECRCAEGAGHGPYWYGFRHRNGELESRYFGKRDPRRDARRRGYESKGYTSALKVFGLLKLHQPPTARQVQLRYEDLATRHGGDTSRMQRIDAAHEVLRRRHGGGAS
jgi:hypothetical protein